MKNVIKRANKEGVARIENSQPFLVSIKYAHEVLPGLNEKTVGHSGPPLSWDQMCGPMKGAILGAIKYEGWTDKDEEAEELVSTGGIKLVSNHSLGAVGPMSGIITRSMPLFEVKNETFSNYSYSSFNEGLGKVLRFGANDDAVVGKLKWIEKILAPALQEVLLNTGPINLKVIMIQALLMGDEMHQRNIAASLLFARSIMKDLAKIDVLPEDRARIVSFLMGNEQFFLNLAMAAAKATMDSVQGIENSSLVTAMSRNGTNFGIKISGLGDIWFEARAEVPQGLFFPGFSQEDANFDMGDSAILECMGLGGFSMSSAPAVVRFVGAGTMIDAERYTRDMSEITVGKSEHYLIPTLDFEGIPIGIDIRKVVETGILPVINTGIAHNQAGIGQIGAGIVRAPMECFIKALVSFSEKAE